MTSFLPEYGMQLLMRKSGEIEFCEVPTPAGDLKELLDLHFNPELVYEAVASPLYDEAGSLWYDLMEYNPTLVRWNTVARFTK